MVILGAGASRACPNNHPHLPMPLLRDLPDVLSRFSPQSSRNWFGQNLNRLLQLTNGNIEVLLTLLYRLNNCFFMPRRQNTLEAKFIEQILASSALPEIFVLPDDCGQAVVVLELLRTLAVEDPIAVTSFSPLNFFTLFQGALREYFQASFQRYPCPLHLRLFEELARFDCVVSFNYDQIADYTLHSAGKLTPFSFQGLGFDEIILPAAVAADPIFLGIADSRMRQDIHNRINCVKFLKVHGSFNWFCRMEEEKSMEDDWTYLVGSPPRLRQSVQGGPEVRYCLGNPKLVPHWTNWTLAPVIFPFLTKDFVYRANQMFGRHMVAFQYELQNSEEIYLVGKSFQNSDHELNGMIRYATYGKPARALHIIDPNQSADFVPFHCALFNAHLGRRYASLEEYAQTESRG
jgi:hypothetical protein